jgi:drug/metabolite transporter (DMT)-like permease
VGDITRKRTAAAGRRKHLEIEKPAATRVRQRTVTHAPETTRSPLQTVYQFLLGVAGGFSLGWFAWVFSDRLGGDSTPPFWPFAVAGAIVGVLIAQAASGTARGRKWINLLWIPLVAFVVLMTAIIMALRAWGS